MNGSRSAALTGMALLALFALVAVASRAHRPGGGTGSETAHAPTLIADYLSTMALILLPLGAIVLVWVLAHRRMEQLQSGRVNWRRTAVSVLAFALLLTAAVSATNLRRSGSQRQQQTTPGAVPPPKAAKGKAAKSRSVYQAHFRWLPVVILASLGAGVAVTFGWGIVRRRRHGDAWAEQAQLAIALDEVLADTLDDLRGERDPRRAVIRAYARMERTFAAYGVPRDAAEAPLEYLARVLDSLQVSTYSVRRLTQLFERAKFSPHEIDSTMQADAIEALVGLRAELEEGRTAA